MSTATTESRDGHEHPLPGVRTFRGRTVEDLIPQIKAELGPDAIILREREGVMGGLGGFFAQRCVEIEARAAARIDVYDDDYPEQPIDPPPYPHADGRFDVDVDVADAGDDVDAVDPPLTPSFATSLRQAEVDAAPVRTSRFPERDRQRGARVQAEADVLAAAKQTARMAADAAARREAEEAQEAARIEAEVAQEAARIAAEVAQEAARIAAEVAQEAARIEAEEAACLEAEEAAGREAEETARLEAEDAARLQDEQIARLAAEEAARLEAEEAARLQAAARAAEHDRALTLDYEARLAVEREARLAAEREVALATERAARLSAERQAALAAEREAIALDPAAVAPPLARLAPGPHVPPGPRVAPVVAAPAADAVAGNPRGDLPTRPASAAAARRRGGGLLSRWREPAPHDRHRAPVGAPAPVDLVAVAAIVTELTGRGISEDRAKQLTMGVIAHRAPFESGSDIRDATRSALAASFPASPVLPAAGAAIAIVGAGGSGKTRCVAALATAYARASNLPVSVASLGARDRAKELQNLLAGENVRVIDAKRSRAVDKARARGLLILDTASVAPGDEPALARLTATLGPLRLDGVYVTLPATLSAHAGASLLASFATLEPAGIAVTHLDETDQLGVAVELAVAAGVPLTYLHEGLELTRAIIPADPAVLAARLLGSGRVE